MGKGTAREEWKKEGGGVRGYEVSRQTQLVCLSVYSLYTALLSSYLVSSVQPRKKRANVLLYSSPVCCNTFEYVSMVWYYKERVLAVLISHHIIDVIDRHSSHRME